MRLISTSKQVVKLGEAAISFAQDDFIITEHSHKYTVDSFTLLANSAGWIVRSFWTGEDQLFSLWYLERGDDAPNR